MTTKYEEEDGCTHTVTVDAHEIRNPSYNYSLWLEGDSDYAPIIYVEEDEHYTYVDISIRHYKCTQCNKIFSY